MTGQPDTRQHPGRQESRAEVMAFVRALTGLVLPRDCAGCGRFDRALCRGCRARLSRADRCEQWAPHLSGASSAPLPSWALDAYRDTTRHAVLAWKSGGRPDVAAPLTAAIRAAALAHAASLLAAAPPGPVLVVPAPSGAARRRAGRFVVGELADAVGHGLHEATGRRVLVADLLRRRPGSGHRLSAAARGRDRLDAVRCCVPVDAGTACVLVDDVVTTGATLAACARALTGADAVVVGALVLAVTLPPGVPVNQTSTSGKETLRQARPLV